MSKHIYLAITKGCEACRIMSNILKNFHLEHGNDFDMTIIDFKALPDWIKINVPLTDFPTLIFVDDNVIKYHISGTITLKKLVKIAKDINFI